MLVVILIEIKILDINDNSFVFKEDIENIFVKEFVLLGVELLIMVVEDLDIGNNFV